MNFGELITKNNHPLFYFMETKFIHRYGRKWAVYSPPLFKSKLPYKSGTYVIRIKNNETKNWTIIYAGETKDLNRRMPSHSITHAVSRQIKSYGTTDKIELLFYPCEWIERKKLERSIIYKYFPMYNFITKYQRQGKIYERNKTRKNKYYWLYSFK